jgi:hypothetical protein
MSLWRCSQCHKAGLEDDFVFVPVDAQHEVIMCFECAPPEAMQQTWPVDEELEDDSE